MTTTETQAAPDAATTDIRGMADPARRAAWFESLRAYNDVRALIERNQAAVFDGQRFRWDEVRALLAQGPGDDSAAWRRLALLTAARIADAGPDGRPRPDLRVGRRTALAAARRLGAEGATTRFMVRFAGFDPCHMALMDLFWSGLLAEERKTKRKEASKCRKPKESIA